MSDQPSKILTPEGEFQQAPAGPTGPPCPPTRAISEKFREVEQFLEGVVADQGVLLDICLSKAARIVERVHAEGMAGIDFMADTGQSPRTVMMSIAAPLAVELYKQSIKALDLPENATRLKELVEKATS